MPKTVLKLLGLTLISVFLLPSNLAVAAFFVPKFPEQVILKPAQIVSADSQAEFVWKIEPEDALMDNWRFSLIMAEDDGLDDLWTAPVFLYGQSGQSYYSYTLTEHQAVPQGKIFYWQVKLYDELGDLFLLSNIGSVQVLIDPLILQYEPVLYLHPEENYYPTSAAHFAEASSLWDKGDSEKPVITEYDVSLDKLGQYKDETYYLQFVEGLDEKNPNPQKALTDFNELKNVGMFPYAYYAYKMTDFDEVYNKEYIVLQYWLFYTFNDWLDKVGMIKAINNHEGDWEVVMVFLDKLTMMPEYAAYSAHHNAGEVEMMKFQYDIVRQKWNQIETKNNHPIVYVALGSHANYFKSGNHRIYIKYDLTSDLGPTLDMWNRFILNNQNWLDYQGNWGVWPNKEGFNGPQCPKYTNDGNQWNHPIKWAGIDKVAVQEIKENKDTEIELEKLTVTINAEQNGQITISPHQEFLQSNDESKVLPRYYQIDSDINNFSAELRFEYTDQELENFNISENELGILQYDEQTKKWHPIDSAIDKIGNIITAIADHFSIYSLGVSLAEFDKKTTDNLSAQVNNTAYDANNLILSFDLSFKNQSQDIITLPVRFIVQELETGVSLENPDGISLDEKLFIEFGQKGQLLANGQTTEIKNVKIKLPGPQCILIEYEVFGVGG